MGDLQIVDSHTHVQRSEEHGREIYNYFLGGVGDPVVQGTVPEVLRLMKETNVVHTNFLMFTWSGRYYRDGRYTLPDEPSRRKVAERELKARIVQRVIDNNEWAVATVAEHKNLSFFCGIDPVLMDAEGAVSEIGDKVAHGALGVKIVPVDLGIEGNDRRLWPIYEYLQAKDLPILSQTGSRLAGFPRFFHEALRDFPHLKLICAHLGHNPVFGKGSDAEVLELMSEHDSVYTDCSFRLPEVANGQITPDEMVAHLRKLGTDRVLYGSNWVFVELARQLAGKAAPGVSPAMTETKKGIEVLKTLPLTDSELENIASRNFAKITGLSI